MRNIFYIIIALQLISCLQKTNSKEVKISWNGGSDLSSIAITVNSVDIDAGPNAYASFIRQLESAPDGSHLHFIYPIHFIEENYEKSGGADPLPFNGDSNSQQIFFKLCLRKRFSYSMEPNRSNP